jgi:integrase
LTRKADAERWLDEIRGDLLRGTHVDPAAGRVLLADFARTWLEAQPHRAGTALLYERTLRLHVYPRIGDRPLASIRRSDIQALITSSASTWRPRRWRTTSGSSRRFNAAVEDQLIPVRLPAGITFHRLRHTYASLLVDGGESVTVVADRMGHTNARETVLRTTCGLAGD